MLLTENQLDEWVRGNAEAAQGVIVEALFRLVAASVPRPHERRFPLADSVGQHGPDGLLYVDVGLDPFVPDGRSFWEVGTGIDAGSKATSDYRTLTDAIPQLLRAESTFIFLTPLSGRRDWEGTWKADQQGDWLTDRRARNDWAGVRVIDGTRLIDWLKQFPAVELWLAQRILGIRGARVESAEQRWRLLESIGEPPSLARQVFLVNRDEARAKLTELLSGDLVKLRLETHFPEYVPDFVAAQVRSLDDEILPEAAGRCLIVSRQEEWVALCDLPTSHVLVAHEDLDLNGDAGMRLIQRARQGGHAVVFGGLPGGHPDPASVVLANPTAYQLQEALRAGGHSEERSRTLAQRSAGDLGTLLRLLQNLSATPGWAEASTASDLAIAELLGAWDERHAADIELVEGISGNSYGAWIGRIGEIVRMPGTPLTYVDGTWRFRSRYEGWYALGPRIREIDLDRLKTAAATALGERDPTLDLPPDERVMAPIRSIEPRHSNMLRHGLAETLALLGSHPHALTGISPARAAAAAIVTIRELLEGADWKLWASLDRLLPELAEAAPDAFLDAAEAAIREDPSPIRDLFKQEHSGVFGRTYLSGLLWALETLAWSPDYLSRVSIALGRMAELDPGGRWSNRPSNSLTTIFLPWLPQTAAPIPRRKAALSALLEELPEVGWTLLLSLLPNASQVSTGSRRPSWRQWIPEDWSQGVTRAEYAQVVRDLSDLALEAATGNLKRLVTLVEQVDDLPPESRERVLSHLNGLGEWPEEDRESLWRPLAGIVSRHRSFPEAHWVLPTDVVNRMAQVADLLQPREASVVHRRLFTERTFELFEGRENFAEQTAELEGRRQSAVQEIREQRGVQGVVEFAQTVESPWRVGIAFGYVSNGDVDAELLPALLESDSGATPQFISGYVWGRYAVGGESWIDSLAINAWPSSNAGAVLAFTPFEPSIWERAAALPDAGDYWRRTPANPFGSKADNFSRAVDHLLEFDRPFAALRCLSVMHHKGLPLDVERTIAALRSGVASTETPDQMASFELVELIKGLQVDGDAPDEAVSSIEWAYLPLLDEHSGAAPVRLEQKLADEPDFFAQVVQTVFRGVNQDAPTEVPPEQAANGYRLLTDWRTPPGTHPNRPFDGAALGRWLDTVVALTTPSGHRDIALNMAGQVLRHLPPDETGLWMDRTAAAVINASDLQPVRDGLRTGIVNARGAHFVDPTGAAERELASQYRRQADAMDDAGFGRVATTIRQLAESYDREAIEVQRRTSADEIAG